MCGNKRSVTVFAWLQSLLLMFAELVVVCLVAELVGVCLVAELVGVCLVAELVVVCLVSELVVERSCTQCADSEPTGMQRDCRPTN